MSELEPMNLTPSWETVVKVCILTLEEGKDEESKKFARKELVRLAQAVDKAQAEEEGGEV